MSVCLCRQPSIFEVNVCHGENPLIYWWYGSLWRMEISVWWFGAISPEKIELHTFGAIMTALRKEVQLYSNIEECSFTVSSTISWRVFNFHLNTVWAGNISINISK